MKLLNALLGRTSEVDEDARRPLGLVIEIDDMLVRTAWSDWKLSKDGETEWRGFQPLDPRTSTWIFGDEVPDELAKAGCYICAVAGITQYSGRVTSDFAPGREVMLAREPGNRYDKNAIAVRGLDGRVVAGYVPRQIARRIAPKMDRGDRYGALVIWELRKTGGRGRDGMRLFVGPNLRVLTTPAADES